MLTTTLAFAGQAHAHVPLFAPRVSLSLALDWNNLAVRALHQPPRATDPPPRRRHAIGKLSVTDGTPAPATATLDTQAVDRVETWARSVMTPRYDRPDPQHRAFRTMYVTPYAPYFGCYGLSLTVESDALLR